jgi:hypothetical protein
LEIICYQIKGNEDLKKGKAGYRYDADIANFLDDKKKEKRK